jgi:hypothetical protein
MRRHVKMAALLGALLLLAGCRSLGPAMVSGAALTQGSYHIGR